MRRLTNKGENTEYPIHKRDYMRMSLVIGYVTCPHDNMRAPGPRIRAFPSHRSPNARVRLPDSAGLAAFPRIRESSWDSHSAP
jgi:hypothetical protein